MKKDESTVDGLHTWENCNEQHFNCYLTIFLLLVSSLYRIHHKDGTKMRGRLISWEGREPDCSYYICWHWQAWGVLQKVSMTSPLYIFVMLLCLNFELYWKRKGRGKEDKGEERRMQKEDKGEERKGEDKDKMKKKGKNISRMEGGIKKGVRWLPVPSS